MWSASMGAPRSMSRNMEAVSPEPAVVKTPRFSSMKRLLGGKPCWVAIVVHSSRRRMARSAAPPARCHQPRHALNRCGKWFRNG
jgi:hypothetical protein